jgi:regulator of cell morphogenesis and NO signaling
MKISEQKTVAEVVTENIKAAHVFKKHGIDFCCGGGVTIEKACEKNGVDYTVLGKELEEIDENISSAHNYDAWHLSFLIDYIVNTHHKYVEESIPLLLQYAAKVANVHGHHYKEVIEINELVIAVAKELAVHMKKEELILFPFIKQLVIADKQELKLEAPDFGTANNLIESMESEHENAGDIFKRIAEISNNYTAPEEACNTFRALYSKLQEFEEDLHHHVHLENNILFPKTIKLELESV